VVVVVEEMLVVGNAVRLRPKGDWGVIGGMKIAGSFSSSPCLAAL
jgi:hypothetical protein